MDAPWCRRCTPRRQFDCMVCRISPGTRLTALGFRRISHTSWVSYQCRVRVTIHSSRRALMATSCCGGGLMAHSSVQLRLTRSAKSTWAAKNLMQMRGQLRCIQTDQSSLQPARMVASVSSLLTRVLLALGSNALTSARRGLHQYSSFQSRLCVVADRTMIARLLRSARTAASSICWMQKATSSTLALSTICPCAHCCSLLRAASAATTYLSVLTTLRPLCTTSRTSSLNIRVLLSACCSSETVGYLTLRSAAMAASLLRRTCMAHRTSHNEVLIWDLADKQKSCVSSISKSMPIWAVSWRPQEMRDDVTAALQHTMPGSAFVAGGEEGLVHWYRNAGAAPLYS